VLVQGGGHGSEAAAPVVRDVVKAYYDKRDKKTEGQITAQKSDVKTRTGSVLATAAPVADTREQTGTDQQ
jgi:hypothetical protein